MSTSEPSSKEFLRNVLMSHTELALDLIGKIQSFNTGDSSYRYQMAAIIVFLAGVDKALSLAFELLYLAGKVDWDWMSPDKRSKPRTGFIECNRGMTAKIIKLKELGVDITHLQWLIDLRNEYIHSCHIHVGYIVGLDDVGSEIRLNPSGPAISYPLAPMTVFESKEIRHYAEQLVDQIGSFIDNAEWYKGWVALARKMECLPKNPEPEYTQILNEPEKESEILNTLNKKFVGDGARLLL